jgi:hypothetical protein
VGNGIANFLNVNRSVTSLTDEARSLRLPRMSQFPKLDGTAVRQASAKSVPVVSNQPGGHGAVLLAGGSGALPEMATDVINADANYAVENVKRDRSNTRPWAGVGLGQLLGRVLGGHRAERR